MASRAAVGVPPDAGAPVVGVSPAHDERHPHLLGWSWLVVHLAARVYRAFLLTLAAVAFLPTLGSWSGFVVRSGSMEPTISVGDVVVAQPLGPADDVPLGRVVVFPNPAKSGSNELLVHRVVERMDDGTYSTAGDANATYDAETITSADLNARARLLVPWVGHVHVWLAEGAVLTITGWMLLTLLAFGLARRRHDKLPRGGRSGRGWLVTARRTRRRSRPGAVVGTGLAIAVAAGVGVNGTHVATASFTARTTSAGSSWTVAKAPAQPYTGQVLADRPYAYYQMDEASGTVAADSSGNNRPGAFTAVAAYRQSNGLPRNGGFAVRLAGLGRLVSGGPALSDPNTYSLEIWFRTTTTAGGKLIGFESTRNATSLLADRHVFMRPDGRLAYGGWIDLGGTQTIVSPQAYNNGGWHHLVLTAVPRGQRQDAVMYVDGRAVASGTTTRTGNYSGWWRVGSGSTALLSGHPNADFAGTVDQAAIYPTPLSAARVQSHWAAR